MLRICANGVRNCSILAKGIWNLLTSAHTLLARLLYTFAKICCQLNYGDMMYLGQSDEPVWQVGSKGTAP